MLWIVLLLVAVFGIFINSFRLFFLALVAMAITAFPLVVLPSIGGIVIWLIKANWR
jgi:hypothetical protein